MVANVAVLVVGEIIAELPLAASLPVAVAVVPIKPLAAAAMTRTISSCNPNDLRIASSTSSTSTSTSPLLLLPPPSASLDNPRAKMRRKYGDEAYGSILATDFNVSITDVDRNALWNAVTDGEWGGGGGGGGI